MHSDADLNQRGECFRRIFVDLVPGGGDDMQMGLRQECVQLPGGFEVRVVLRSADDRHRTADFGKL